MTPKDKAEELIDKNYQIFLEDDDEHFIDTAKRISKQCALIAVNETIEAMKFNRWQNRNEIEFYQEVKQEIENL